MKNIGRRHFLRTATGTTLGFMVARNFTANAATAPIPPQVALGNTGITLSRVGQGTGMRGGNRQSNHTRMGFEKFVSLLRHAYDNGVTFFDVADLYGTHVYLREALRYIPREKVTILTKLWTDYDGPADGTPADFKVRAGQSALQRFRHEIATDHVDIVLLHCMRTPMWEERMAPYMDVLSEAKEKKQVRAVGVSCHNLEAVKRAAKSSWVDVILARTNPTGAKMDGKPEQVIPVLKEAKANGKAIIGMKIYGEGSLANMKEKCIQYAQGEGVIDCMTVGAETPEQMSETLRLVERYPAKTA